MDRDAAAKILSSLEQEWKETNRRGAALSKLIEGYRELFPDLKSDDELLLPEIPDDIDRPRGVEAVLRVLQESPGKWFTVRLMTKELEERSWLPASADPESAIRAALARAHAADESHIDKGRGKKTGQITYRYSPASARPDGESDHEPPGYEHPEGEKVAEAS